MPSGSRAQLKDENSNDMIRAEEVYKIGVFNKPHGIKGELQFTFTDDIFDRVDCDYLICLLDGIYVPFFIEEYRFRSDTTALMKLEGIDSDRQARMFTNVEVYYPKEYVSDDESDFLTWQYFVGFEVDDERHGCLGKVTAVDESTMNILVCIEKNGKEILLPAHEEFIRSVDKKKRRLTVLVPEGLIE